MENNGRDLTAYAHYDTIERATVMGHISVENVRNISHGTHFACIILTYSKIMAGKPVFFFSLFFPEMEFLPGQETHWSFSMTCTSPDG